MMLIKINFKLFDLKHEFQIKNNRYLGTVSLKLNL